MKRMLPLLLAGCGAMESPLSIVDDLRVVAMVVEPAAPAPGEPFTVEPIVIDANGAGYDTWTWWCVLDQCAEGPLPPLPDELPFPAQLSTYACAPQGCEAPGDPADPDAWLAERPFETTSLTTQAMLQSPDVDTRLNTNPVLSIDGPERVAPGETAELTALVDDVQFEDLRLAGYASKGSFPEQAWAAEPGEVVVQWTAPEASGEIELVWVLTDGLGGVAVARVPMIVDAP